jgi:hypothetical protein
MIGHNYHALGMAGTGVHVHNIVGRGGMRQMQYLPRQILP